MFRILCLLTLSAVTVVIAGCADNSMAEVSGTVTIDGKPLRNANVTFEPLNGERMSRGVTDTNGYYELRFSSQTTGAKVGKHKVSITTFQAVTYTDDGYGPPMPEIVPIKYNKATTLTAAVDSGSNTIDWDLDSRGEIYQQSAATADAGDGFYGG